MPLARVKSDRFQEWRDIDRPWGLINQPLEWLLYSDLSVILAFVHLYTLFVVLPIIAPSLIGVALFGFALSYDEFARRSSPRGATTRCRSKSSA